MTKKLILASIAAAALGLSACGGNAGDTTTTPAPTTSAAVSESSPAASPDTTASTPETATTEATTETSPTAEPTEESSAPAPSGDLPFPEGKVDVAAFADFVGPAMQSVKTMKQTASNPVSGEPQVTLTDMSDRSNVRTYNVSQVGDTKIEVVSEGAKIYTRTGGGEWKEEKLDPALQEQMQQQSGQAIHSAEAMKKMYSSVELVSAAEKKFNVVIDFAAALGSSPGSAGMPATVWLGDDNRIVKQEVALDSLVVVTDMEYDVPVEIPAVN